ncbi:MAG TPA: hypothetical protein VMZ24_00650 [Patescibacteria group bacterium]|jgi:hypothetical protein|nr:hypothetical protein [Patescibacteria group bacterium]
MSEKIQKVANIVIRNERPTEVTSDDLHGWVIWQFPRQLSGGLSGAVHPPLAGHTWYPAIIGYLDKRIQIHGHTDLEFDSPEEAANWLVTLT